MWMNRTWTRRSWICKTWLMLPVFGLAFAGCGSGSKPAGCPSDLSIPDEMEILGAQHDDSLFILRLRTDALKIPEVVKSFKDSMKDNEWEVKVDSATDTGGGEIEFVKDARKCVVFIALESNKNNSKNNAIKIDVKCDRENVR